MNILNRLCVNMLNLWHQLTQFVTPAVVQLMAVFLDMDHMQQLQLWVKNVSLAAITVHVADPLLYNIRICSII